MKNKFYITTPIYYPNDIPHIGHAYTTIAADILARWHRLRGESVWFLTGTDEHGKKIENAAKKSGKTPKQFVDELVPKFKEAWKKLNISYDNFIRTTDKEHEKVVQDVLKKVYKKGDIYLGKYEGYYCTECEAYYTEKDLQDGNCPIHKKPIEKLKEESYFFKLSKYQNKLLELYKKNKKFILPDLRKQEIINRVQEGLQDLSISRTSFSWGIPLPFDKKHIAYVWFDALLNYISGANKNWPANVHLVGKDILWFHVVIWPAILLSAGYKLPETIFAHGWWTFNKEKISKSRGKVINVDELISIAGVDSARYFLFRETPFGQDGDFSEKALVDRHNNELADKLGNLVSRVSALAEKYGIQKTENKLAEKLKLKEIEKHVGNYEIDKALNVIFEFVDRCNEYVQENELWKSGDRKKLYELADSIKAIAILLFPFMPESCEKIAKLLGFKIAWKEIAKPLQVNSIKKAEILFKKVEVNQKLNKPIKIEGIMDANTVQFNEWMKLDLRVGKILKIEDVENADKLYKLEVDLGKEIGKRTLVAGLKKFYTPKDLKGKKVVIFTNLEPKTLKGIESKGMILAAVNEDESKVVLIEPAADIEVGSRIR